MANGNGNKIFLRIAGVLLMVALTGYLATVQGQISDTKATAQQDHADDSTTMATHLSLDMHKGAEDRFVLNELRYVRDSASTAQFRKETNTAQMEIQESISNLTVWLKENTNRDSSNGSP